MRTRLTVAAAQSPGPPGSPIVVVLAGDGPRAGLVQALGDRAAGAVSELLLARACAWARAAVGEAGVRVLPGRGLADAFRGDAESAGPVIAILPELATWHPGLADAVLGDFAEGCAISFAPIFDGGLYLLALTSGRPELRSELSGLELDPDNPGHRPLGGLLGEAERAGWEVGLLRPERGVRSAQDVHALRADPLTDPELRGLLG